LAVFPQTPVKFNAHAGNQRLRFTNYILRRLSRVDGAMRREKSGRAFHLELSRCVRFNLANPTCRHSALNKHAFCPDAIILHIEAESPIHRLTLLSYRRKKIQ
jgi:hypothetical protein